MKFRGHETFSIRKGWLSKGIKAVASNPQVFLDKENNPMDVFGIGSNMVKSLRYWLQATGLSQEGGKGKRGQGLTELGTMILKNDPYLEEYGTLCLLHYNLVKGRELSTAWHFFFNQFNMTEFEKDDFVASISNWVKLQGVEVSSRSLEEDFNCIINTYLPRYKTAPEKADPESNMECPLSELGLIDISGVGNKVYLKSAPVSMAVDPMIIVAIIADNANGKSEVLMSDLLNGENNIGRVFNLDVISMLQLLDAAEQTGYVKLVRTAGLDVLHIETDMHFAECVQHFYDDLF